MNKFSTGHRRFLLWTRGIISRHCAEPSTSEVRAQHSTPHKVNTPQDNIPRKSFCLVLCPSETEISMAVYANAGGNVSSGGYIIRSMICDHVCSLPKSYSNECS